MSRLISLKTQIRSRDYDASRRFYTEVLGLRILEEWEERPGFVAGFGDGAGGGLIEVTEVDASHESYDEAFTRPVANDKIVLQLRTDSVDEWARRLEGVWPFVGPVGRPWGNRYLWLRDPDGIEIALFEGEI